MAVTLDGERFDCFCENDTAAKEAEEAFKQVGMQIVSSE